MMDKGLLKCHACMWKKKLQKTDSTQNAAKASKTNYRSYDTLGDQTILMNMAIKSKIYLSRSKI